MPGMDGRGPQGTGPIGRRMGPCGNGQSGLGRGRGFRRGGRFGWEMTSEPISVEDEKVLLEKQKSWLESQLASISKKLQGS